MPDEALLLDEPLSALDEVFREQMRIEFLKIQKALKVTTVYVTHDQREAMILADKTIAASVFPEPVTSSIMKSCGLLNKGKSIDMD